MLFIFFLCLSSVVLNGSTLNNSGSITPHSHACCSLRHLGVGLGRNTFCFNLREKIYVANPSLVRVPQREARCSLRHLGVGFSGQYIWWKTMEETENSANLSRAHVAQRHLVYLCCMASSGSTLKQTGDITHLSCASFPLGYLCAGLCGKSSNGKPMEQTAPSLISFSLMIALTIYLWLLFFRRTRGYTRTRVKHRRRLGSGYWTRRRIYWRRRKI